MKSTTYSLKSWRCNFPTHSSGLLAKSCSCEQRRRWPLGTWVSDLGFEEGCGPEVPVRDTQHILPPSRIHWSLCVRRPTDDTVFLEQQGGLQGLTWRFWGHGLLCGVLVQRGPDLYTGQSSLPWCVTWGCILTWWSSPTVLNICCFSHPWSPQPHRETPAAPGSAQRAMGGLASVSLWTMCSWVHRRSCHDHVGQMAGLEAWRLGPCSPALLQLKPQSPDKGFWSWIPRHDLCCVPSPEPNHLFLLEMKNLIFSTCYQSNLCSFRKIYKTQRSGKKKIHKVPSPLCILWYISSWSFKHA